MKSIAMKFVALVLAALCLLTAVAGGFAIALVSVWESEGWDVDQALKEEFRYLARDHAYAQARYWAILSQSTAPREAVKDLARPYTPAVAYDPMLAGLSLCSFRIILNGQVVESGGSGAPENARSWSFFFQDITPTYTQIHGQALGDVVPGGVLERIETYDGRNYSVFTCQNLTFQVEVVLYQAASFTLWDVLEWVWQIRRVLLVVLLGSILLLAICMVYLCWAAGRKPKSQEIRPGGLNRIPLDLYAVADGIAAYFGLMLMFEGVTALVGSGLSRLAIFLAVIDGFVLCLLVVAYIFCFAAQIKRDGFWWRYSLIGWCAIRLFRLLRLCWWGVKAGARMIPLMWQWLLTAFAMVAVVLVLLVGANSYYYPRNQFCSMALIPALLGCVAIVLYGGWCFATILKAARRMAAGDLNRKIDTKYLMGNFRDCALHLNDLSAAAMRSAREQMKSERMKTELIANVSHDIKTPLTSIINYVDLLQKPHGQEEHAAYLDVLARQSQRLKKLTEDLVEMSKASTGNVPAELTELDACETVRQALGEFAGRLEEVPLQVVFTQPEEPLMIRADGRLTWRVLNNLLGNAAKYAQPGSRLYMDVTKIDNRVLISLKNMSREQLNVTAEELMERFVRGDASRHTEGSGLGLNIAKGLMEAQNGTLHLFVDGDLFKVTLFFPAGQNGV